MPKLSSGIRQLIEKDDNSPFLSMKPNAQECEFDAQSGVSAIVFPAGLPSSRTKADVGHLGDGPGRET